MAGVLRSVGPLLAAAALACMAAGCASVHAPERDARVVADAPFTAEGRLSARHGSDAVSANYRWTHAPPRDELALSTPLGQTVAELTGDASVPYASVRGADGRVLEATDWSALTTRALGFPLPVTGLASWIRGGPHPGSAFESETDGMGRATLLRQDGWEIVLDYADERATSPARLRLAYPDVEVRIAVSALEPSPSPAR